MIITFSPEQSVEQETLIVNQLLEKGIDLFHIRKYGLSDDAMLDYINAIDAPYRNRLVLHSHFHLAKENGIGRLHFNEMYRAKKEELKYADAFVLSTSVHSIEVFNGLGKTWAYAFLSPIFSSISKPGYGAGNSVFDSLQCRNNVNVSLIGLGGIDRQNYKKVLDAGADGIALLGGIWKSGNPIDVLSALMQ